MVYFYSNFKGFNNIKKVFRQRKEDCSAKSILRFEYLVRDFMFYA